MRWSIHSHVAFSLIKKQFLVIWLSVRKDCNLNNPSLLSLFQMHNRYSPNLIFLRHQRRGDPKLALPINIQEQLIILTLLKLGPIHIAIIINTNIQLPTLTIQKSYNIPHNKWNMFRLGNIFEMFELDLTALDHWDYLAIVKIVECWVKWLLWTDWLEYYVRVNWGANTWMGKARYLLAVLLVVDFLVETCLAFYILFYFLYLLFILFI